MSAADARPGGPLVALARVIRGLGSEGAARNVARLLDERDRELGDLERRLAGITVNRPVVSDVA
jgi:hypothetical protein